jgi:hypothetical protein
MKAEGILALSTEPGVRTQCPGYIVAKVNTWLLNGPDIQDLISMGQCIDNSAKRNKKTYPHTAPSHIRETPYDTNIEHGLPTKNVPRQ